MSTWDTIDPHLKLKRIRVRNFRNIRNIDITIPEDKNIICLVGPNGGGKSALLSIIINALCNLTHESIPDRNDESVTQGFSLFRLLWSKEEIGTEGPALAVVMDWETQHAEHRYPFLVIHPESLHHPFVTDLCK